MPLQVDTAQVGRLTEIQDNLSARVDEAKANSWLGDVDQLLVSVSPAVRERAGSVGLVKLGRLLRGPPSATSSSWRGCCSCAGQADGFRALPRHDDFRPATSMNSSPAPRSKPIPWNSFGYAPQPKAHHP